MKVTWHGLAEISSDLVEELWSKMLSDQFGPGSDVGFVPVSFKKEVVSFKYMTTRKVSYKTYDDSRGFSTKTVLQTYSYHVNLYRTQGTLQVFSAHNAHSSVIWAVLKCLPKDTSIVRLRWDLSELLSDRPPFQINVTEVRLSGLCLDAGTSASVIIKGVGANKFRSKFSEHKGARVTSVVATRVGSWNGRFGFLAGGAVTLSSHPGPGLLDLLRINIEY